MLSVSKTFFQDDLGGKLLNMADFFPSSSCSSIFGDFGSTFQDIGSVIDKDEGPLQGVIASLLSTSGGGPFYVDAQSQAGDKGYLFQYGESDSSDETLYHYSADYQGGTCLTFSYETITDTDTYNDGIYSYETYKLVTKGVDCETELKPLCLRTESEDGSSVASAGDLGQECEKCQDAGDKRCRKWVKLSDYQEGGVTIENAEICLETCGTSSYADATDYCMVSSVMILLSRPRYRD